MKRANKTIAFDEHLLTKDMGMLVFVNPKVIEKIMNKSTDPTVTPITEEVKDQNSKYSLSKFDDDLYHEEDDVANKVIRVKRVSMPNNNEKWKITSDNKLIFTIEGTKISKKEREYLQTVDGFNFILSQAKVGIKSLNSFKVELKKIFNKPKPKKPGKKSVKK